MPIQVAGDFRLTAIHAPGEEAGGGGGGDGRWNGPRMGGDTVGLREKGS